MPLRLRVLSRGEAGKDAPEVRGLIGNESAQGEGRQVESEEMLTSLATLQTA